MTILVVEGPDSLGVTRLRLNRPNRANALDSELVENFIDAVTTASTNGTRVLLVDGEGKNFCAGFDLSDVDNENEASLVLRFIRIEQMLQYLATAPFLTVAHVRGAAFGAGADIVVACDLRWASSDGRFRFPGYSFGVALGTRRLAALSGSSSAQDILATGRILRGPEALNIGLITRLLDGETTTSDVEKIAQNLSSLDQVSAATLVTRSRVKIGDPDADLAMLVHSVTRPGLKKRLKAYLSRPKIG